MELLLRHPSCESQNYHPSGMLKLVGDKIIAEFEMADTNEFIVDQQKSYTTCKNWELWNSDVFEIFYQVRKKQNDFNAPYYEINMDTLGRSLFLKTIECRKVLFTPFDQPFSIVKTYYKDKVSWRIMIKLNQRGRVYANLNGCFSDKSREYFGLNLAPTIEADFHQPKTFIYLGEIK